MQHFSLSNLPARSAPDSRFTGPVWMQELTPGAMRVTFTPGARTAWHRHPHGQTLLILSGSGLVQKRGEAALSFQAGDVVTVAAGEEHWHGAAPDSVMSHIALQEGQTEWLTQVTDAEYAG